MSFGDSTAVLVAGEDNVGGGLAHETLTRNSLINVQNSVRSLGDQISRLAQCQPSPKIVSIMKSLIKESASTMSTLENQLRQWKKADCSDAATSTRRKLVLPPLEAGFNAELEKLKRFQRMVEATEKQLKSSGTVDSFTLLRPSDGDDAAGRSPTNQTVSSCSPTSVDGFELTDVFKDLLEPTEQQQAIGGQSGSLRSLDRPVSAGAFSPYTESERQSSPMLPVLNPPRVQRDQLPRGQQQCFSSNPIEFAPPVVVGRHFYDQADDDDDKAPGRAVKNVISSLSSSTTTARSTSPTSEEEEERIGSYLSSATTLSNGSSTPSSDKHTKQRHAQQTLDHDSFLEDDYLHQSYRSRPNTSEIGEPAHTNEHYDNDDGIQEFSGLLSRGSLRSASYLDGWHLTVDEPRKDDDLELFVSRERLRGVRKLKAQLSQISGVFRELANIINEQQDDLDLIDSNMMNIKNSTGTAVDELRKANALKQRARRRNFFMILVTLVVGAVVVFVYCLQGPSSPPYALTAVAEKPAVSRSQLLGESPPDVSVDPGLDSRAVTHGDSDTFFPGSMYSKRLPK